MLAFTLQKVTRESEQTLTIVISFDRRLPNISKIFHHRWKGLVERDDGAKVYMSKPPRVAFTRTKSLRDILVTSNYRQGRRQADLDFKKCENEQTVLCAPTLRTGLATL